MPPRARKAAAPTPSIEASGAAETTPDEVSPPVAEEETSPAGPAEAAGEPAPDPASTATEQPASEPDTTPAVTYRWVSVSGGDAAPCRLCAPAGPPAGAGSFGCGHGQWVLVADEAP